MAYKPANHLINIQPDMLPGTRWRNRRWSLVVVSGPSGDRLKNGEVFTSLWTSSICAPAAADRVVGPKGTLVEVIRRTAYDPYSEMWGTAPVVRVNGEVFLLVDSLRAAFEPAV